MVADYHVSLLSLDYPVAFVHLLFLLVSWIPPDPVQDSFMYAIYIVSLLTL